MSAEPYRDRPACAKCGTAIEPDVAQYDDDGRQICAACVDVRDLAAGSERMFAATRGAALVSLGLAAGSCVCVPFAHFLALAAIVVGIGAIGAARTAAATGQKSNADVIIAGVAVTLSALRLVAYFVLIGRLAL